MLPTIPSWWNSLPALGFVNISWSRIVLSIRKVVEFSNTSIRLTTKKLDCGNKGMNKDMYQTLKADQFPTIRIQLDKVIHMSQERIDECSDWVPMKAQTYISITGVERKMLMQIQGRIRL